MSQKDADRSMSVSEAGRLGGNKRKETADYSAMGAKGGETTKMRYGFAHYAEIGYQGGKTTAARHGRDHFIAMGKKGGQRVRELIRKGRAAG
jgi:hypothetical protein